MSQHTRSRQLHRIAADLEADREELLEDLHELAQRVEDHYEAARMLVDQGRPASHLRSALRTALESAAGPRPMGRPPVEDDGESSDPELAAQVVARKNGESEERGEGKAEEPAPAEQEAR